MTHTAPDEPSGTEARMWSYWGAVGCVAVGLLLAAVSHPRLFFGDGPGSFISLDDLFFGAQWGALALALASLLFYAIAAQYGRTPANGSAVPTLSLALLVYLLATGVPHPANRGDWGKRELGLAAFIRGDAKRRAETAEPTRLSAEAFQGVWQAGDGTIYKFTDDRITWSGAGGAGEYSAARCGESFQLEYVERGRDVLQDLGFVWSVHAVARYDAAAANARVPLAQVGCGSADRLAFIRAADDEVWRWTNTLDANAIKDESFILRRVARSDGK